MIKNYTIDYNNNQFILFDLKHKSEECISRREVEILSHEGYTLSNKALSMLNKTV